MEKLPFLLDIKYQALFLQESLVGVDPEKVKRVYDEFQALVDRFYAGSGGLVTERQHTAARDNFEYFIVLLETMIEDRKRQEEEETKNQAT